MAIPTATNTPRPAATSTVPTWTPTPLPTSNPTETPREATRGPNVDDLERVRVTRTDGLGANLRGEPRAQAPVLATIREGAELVIVGDDQIVEGAAGERYKIRLGVKGGSLHPH